MQAPKKWERHPVLGLDQPAVPEAGSNWLKIRFVRGGTISTVARVPSPPLSELHVDDKLGQSRYDKVFALQRKCRRRAYES